MESAFPHPTPASPQPRRKTALLALLLSLGVLSGCDRNVEPFREGEEPQEPDLSRIFPDAGRDSGPPAPPPSAAPSNPPRGEAIAAPSSGGGPIRGRIELAHDRVGDPPPNAVLFVIARRAGVNVGPPVAVVREASPSFPYTFEIGPKNVMIQGQSFEGPLDLSVRIDSDGNVMSKLPGDLKGEAKAEVQPGASGVVIVVDQRL